MPFIDMHCDSLMTLFYEDPDYADLYDSKYTAVDFKRMAAGNVMAQFFAIFVIPSDRYDMHGIRPVSDEEYIQTLYDYYCTNLQKHEELIGPAANADEVMKNYQSGRMSAILSMEDGRAVDGRLENVKRYYDMGVRAMNLTWNAVNCFGFPNSKEPSIMERGLTEFGKEAVQYMQDLGMLVDVSHLSDGGFYDVADICHKPFIASHSNARSLCPHQRNLTDAMIYTLGERGGVAGLNFGPEFLNADIQCPDSPVELIAEHAAYMKNKGGVQCVAIGTDFDGIEGNLEIKDCAGLGVLENALRKRGFTSQEIDQVFYLNVLRVMEDAMK